MSFCMKTNMSLRLPPKVLGFNDCSFGMFICRFENLKSKTHSKSGFGRVKVSLLFESN